MNILLTLLLVINVAIFALLCVMARRIMSSYREIVQFVSAPDEHTPSPLSVIASSVSDIFARSIMAQAKATFMGLQSGENRADKGISADIALDTVSQTNPAIGAILSSFPALRKTLRRNPGLLDLAISKLANKQSQAVIAMPGSNGSGGVKFKL